MARVELRYWAGAETAAGVTSEVVEAPTMREALLRAGADRGDDFARVLQISSFLVNGRRVDAEQLGDPLAGDVMLEVLPPFAGG